MRSTLAIVALLLTAGPALAEAPDPVRPVAEDPASIGADTATPPTLADDAAPGAAFDQQSIAPDSLFEPPPRPLHPMEREILANGKSAFSREILFEMYAARSWSPLWTDPTAALELVDAIRDVDRHGLNPNYYGLGEIEPLAQSLARDDRRDVLLSRAFVRLAFDLRFGRVPVSRFGVADATTKRLGERDNAAELAAAIESGSVREFLEDMPPPFALYKRLGEALQRYREMAQNGGWKPIEVGAPLRPGERDRRVPRLRERLAASGDLDASAAVAASDVYEGDVVEAMRTFQARHGLERDGVAGRQTIEAMNVPASRRVDQIRATMERTRQFLHGLPERFVVVNTASFSAYLIDRGEPLWSGRIIVGKRDLATPVFRTNIEGFTLNPEWNVPPSIVQNELLPGLKRDPNKLQKMRIRRVGERYVQQSGAHSALGRIKFVMPNEHAVYLHDTPTKNLFERRERAFSHGCVRVEHPLQLAALLLDEPGRDEKALQKEVDTGKTKTVRLREPVPVLVMTWSVIVSGDGRVDFLSDLYGQDDEVLAALDGTPLPAKRTITASR